MSGGTENNSRFASIVEAANEIPSSIVRGFNDFSLPDFEESIAGKSGASYLNAESNKIVSYATIGLAVIIGLFGFEMQQHWLLEMFTSDGLLAMLASTTDSVLNDGRVVSFSIRFQIPMILNVCPHVKRPPSFSAVEKLRVLCAPFCFACANRNTPMV